MQAGGGGGHGSLRLCSLLRAGSVLCALGHNSSRPRAADSWLGLEWLYIAVTW